MTITDTYKNNIKELDKFLETMSFSEESEARIRQYFNDPLSILNDEIKRLFAKFDDKIVDYRIPLPSSMMKQEKKYPRDVYLVLNTIADCLSEDNVVLFSTNENNEFVSKIQLNVETVANNCFYINGDKRKVWKYLESKVPFLTNEILKRAKFSNSSEVDFRLHMFGFEGFVKNMNDYIKSLGTRKTSLKDKISELNKNIVIDVNNTEAISNTIRTIFKISSEILGAKMIDADKFKMYISFNAFDWLFASTGETFHSCIDMNSNMAYGIGLLGMCACPDWGMLLYTDDTTKKAFGIEALHIITRSWVCYTNKNDWQVINWYPKDVRSTVDIESQPTEDFRFTFERSRGAKSKSDWSPITFCNGGVAWIYSDLNEFYINKDEKTVHFEMSGRTGINSLGIGSNGKLFSGSRANQSIINAITSNCGSIAGAIDKGFKIREHVKCELDKHYKCSHCGRAFESEESLVYIDSEDIYVCEACLQENYFYCEGCEEYHSLDESYEVYYGDNDWEYELRCGGCVDNSDSIFWDDVANKYYYDDCGYNNLDRNGEQIYVSDYTINRGIDAGTIFEHSDGTYHTTPEPTEDEVVHEASNN